MGRVGEVVDRKDVVARERREPTAGGGQNEPRGIRLKIRLERRGSGRIERRDSESAGFLPFKESLALLEPYGARTVGGERNPRRPPELHVPRGRRVIEKRSTCRAACPDAARDDDPASARRGLDATRDGDEIFGRCRAHPPRKTSESEGENRG